MFDVAVTSRYLYLASTQPVVVGASKAGLVRLQLKGDALAAPRAFRAANGGVTQIAINGLGKRLAYISPDSQILNYEQSSKSFNRQGCPILHLLLAAVSWL